MAAANHLRSDDGTLILRRAVFADGNVLSLVDVLHDPPARPVGAAFLSAYAASNAGVRAVARSLAAEGFRRPPQQSSPRAPALDRARAFLPS
jgi:NAD(P)-dependent dehydrogenase (short-subunit alcohol dehydrogenase family)